jgi:hypothetical protein
VATLTLNPAAPTVKIGMQTEVVVKAVRQFDYAGPLSVELMLPPDAKGLTIDPVTIPAGQDEAKFVIKAAADAPPGNRANLTLKATAKLNDNFQAVHEVKFNVNVVK